MKKIIFVLFIGFLGCSSPVSSPVLSNPLLPENRLSSIIYHQNYALEYSELHEVARWVAYELTADEIAGDFDRTNDFREDPSINTGSATLKDYKGSGYDRGHLAPAADMAFSHTAMSETFFLSNIAPQSPGFNRYGWRYLESSVRSFALQYGSVLVVTGPVLSEDPIEYIGPSNVAVPRSFFKVILSPYPYATAIAFLMPNKKIENPTEDYVVTVDFIEKITGLDFFSFLPDWKETELEGAVDISLWDF